MTAHRSPPEEAIVDAALGDPLVCDLVLGAFSIDGLSVNTATLATLARRHDWSRDRLDRLLTALQDTGVIRLDGNVCHLLVPFDDAQRYAAVLRGVAYARDRHRDLNTVAITLSPPASPSRLMEVLPKTDFSWARLYDTKDSLIELASRAHRRFVVASPFLDQDGLEWITTLFHAARLADERVLIVRGRDPVELGLLRDHQGLLAKWGARIIGYAVEHHPSVRTPVVETFHAKLLLADRTHAYLGSANMNRWSRDVSMECGAIVSGPAVRPVATLIDAIISVGEALRL